jgi:hypothetical protein
MSNNYIIENGCKLNFYEELYKALDEQCSNAENTELCLITNSPLVEKFVQLECNHKFNYIPLYHDILIHKKTFNKLERRILKPTEIRCPYCRNIQNKLLPYYEMDGVKQVHGVNHYDESMDKASKIQNPGANFGYEQGLCCHMGVLHTMDSSGQKNKISVPCKNTYVKLCEQDGKTYCISHKYYALKAHEKSEKMKAKMKEKEDIKLAKQQLKLKEKEDNTKNSAKNISNENTVLSANSESASGCTEILKSGPKKGLVCGCKIKDGSLCGRHLQSHKK